jgi:hypothetical protein
MAYSRSESTLRRILPELSPIKAGRTHKWEVMPGRAWYKASRIREALYIAAHVFPHKYPELALAHSHYVIEVLDDHTVQARPTANASDPQAVLGESILTPTERPSSDVTPIHGLEIQGGVPRTIVGQTSATAIIAWTLRSMPTNDKLVFTEVDLPDSELTQIARWAETRQPKWMVVVNKPERIVTLSPFQPGVPAWRAT